MTKQWRRFAMGAMTLLGTPRGFFIPYRYATAVTPPGRDAYPEIATALADRETAMRTRLAGLDNFADDLTAIGGQPPPAPRFDQSWFPTLDAAIAYALVREHRPAAIVEVGAGHSTRFLARAVTDGGLETRITTIDPAPRALLAGLPVAFLHTDLANAGLGPFAALEAGDIVSIDSSHILMPGTDVDIFLNRIYPALPVGVLVHVHDVFLPDGYPADWHWRGYNEQLALGPILTDGAEILWASHYAATRLADAVASSLVARLPHAPDSLPASLWFVKR